MARSHYIYVVQSTITGQPLACFTVKYEMLNWLDYRRQDKTLSPVAVLRFSDNPGRDEPPSAYIYTEKELFGD